MKSILCNDHYLFAIDDCLKLIEDPEFEQALSTIHELNLTLMKVLTTREVTLTTLNELKNNIEETHNIVQKVKLGGTVVTAAGLVISLTGFGLSFFTFGASLGLTGVGSVLYGVGGAACAGADIGNLVMTQWDLRNAQIILDTDKEMMESAMKLDGKLANLISSLEHKYPTIPSSDVKEMIRLYALPLFNGVHNLYLSKDGVLDIGRAVFFLMESGSKTGSGTSTVWSGLSVWGKRLNVIYAALDVICLLQKVQDIVSMIREIQEYERIGKSTSKAAQIIEEVIFELKQHRNELMELMALGN